MPGAQLKGAAFLIDMNRVFEEVVGRALKRSIEEGYSGKVKLQCTAPLGTNRKFSVRPGMIWQSNGKLKAVADFKYKLPDRNDIAISDVYQVLAYCLRFSVDKVYLVYPESIELESIDFQGRTIEFVNVNIGHPKAERQIEIATLAQRIADTSLFDPESEE